MNPRLSGQHFSICCLLLFRLRAVSLCLQTYISKRNARARALSGDVRGHLRVSDVLLDGPRKERDCS